MHIFLSNVLCKQIRHLPASIQITQESIHHTIEIVIDDDDSWELNNFDKQDSDNSEDEARLNPKAAVDTK